MALTSDSSLAELDFSKSPDGLIPAIIQDASTGRVLMLGYMNEEALQSTLRQNKVVFYSRSRKRLWTKGEESGHFLHLSEIRVDCDKDTLLVKARPQGPVCHTGADTCFNEENVQQDFLAALEQIIMAKKTNPTQESYTARLLAKGINKVAQKVGEEAVELVIEAKDDNRDLFLNEAADLMYHFLVLLAAKDCSLDDVKAVLSQRHGNQK